jgi:hypothetical protein
MKKAIHDTTFIYSKELWADSINSTLKKQDESLQRINETISKSAKTEDKFLNKVTYNTVFTVCVTLFIFTIGIIIDRILKSYDKRKNEKELKAYFKVYLTRISEKTSLSLIQLYRKYYRATNIDTGIPLTAPKILTDDFQRIRNITDKELHKAINDEEVLPKILNCVDFIEKITIEIDYYHKHAIEVSSRNRGELQVLIEQYLDVLAKYYEHVRLNNPTYPYVQFFQNLINQLLIKYHTEKEYKAKVSLFYRNIVRPIQREVVLKQIFRADPIGYEISDIGKRVSYKYNELRRKEIEFRIQYRDFSNKIESAREILLIEIKKVKWE